MHSSAIMTIICTLSLKVFCRFIKYKRNALNDATSTLYYICSYLEKCISIQESPNIFIWMVNVNTSTLVTSIYSLLLKEFSRFIKLEGNALNAARSTLLLICSQFEKCKSIQKSLNFYMDGKYAYFGSCDLNLYIIS